MDSNIDKEPSSIITPEKNGEESNTPDAQINPMTTMTSVPPFQHVDDSQQGNLASMNTTAPFNQPSEDSLSTELNADASLQSTFVAPSFVLDQEKPPSNSSMDNRSIAAWVESTAEAAPSAIERSPSLPSTIIEQVIQRSRGNSTASTLCDHQQSITSDTMTTAQVSIPNEIQRSLSVPVIDQCRQDIDDSDDQITFTTRNEHTESDDMTIKFLPVPESEESEIEKTNKNLQSEEEEGKVEFQGRSPITRESPKKSPNVSFVASISTEPQNKPSVPHRRRRTSWNSSKPKPPSLIRSFSQATNSQQSSLHSQILRKQFKTVLSMPNGTCPRSNSNSTRQSSYISDSVFLSPSATYSSSSRGHSSYSHDTRFSAIPSSISNQSSNQSAIESIPSEAHSSSQLSALNEKDDDDITTGKNRKSRSLVDSRASTTSSRTPSTQSLSSSSGDELHSATKKLQGLSMSKSSKKRRIDKRRDALKQLVWLLEKRPTINPRYTVGCRKNSNPPKPQQGKAALNLFVEVMKI